MPELTPVQLVELRRRLVAAAVLPHQRAALPHVEKMSAVGPEAGSSAVTPHLLALIRKPGGNGLRGGIELACAAVLGDTSPTGAVVAIGEAREDEVLQLAKAVVEQHLRGQSHRGWALLQQHQVPRRAAVLGFLASWLNLQITGISPDCGRSARA